MKLDNLSVGKKILVGFTIPILLFSAFGLWLQLAMISVSDNLKHIKSESISFAMLANDMEKDVIQVQQFLSDISATRGQDGLDDGFKQAEINYADFMTDIAKFETLFNNKGDKAGLGKIHAVQANFEIFYQAGVKMAHGYVEGGPAEGNKMMGDFDKSSEALQHAMQPFVKAQLDEMDASGEKANNDTTNVRTVGMMTGLAVIVLTIAVANLTARSITRPLSLMQATISEVEKHSDFTRKVDVNSTDEVGHTARAFNQLMTRLGDIIRQTRSSVEGIADASHNLTESTGLVTEGSRQQSEATTAAAASADEISATMSNMASRTRESEMLSDISREETRQALAITQESMSGMGRTAQAIKESAANVARLSKS